VWASGVGVKGGHRQARAAQALAQQLRQPAAPHRPRAALLYRVLRLLLLRGGGGGIAHLLRLRPCVRRLRLRLREPPHDAQQRADRRPHAEHLPQRGRREALGPEPLDAVESRQLRAAQAALPPLR
jgi:hypothetical protein